ncbi:bone sialoprotein 2-like isoform X2 [Rana temporaria]|uniref:bone sialoprotein 2-like isoform X2 n=1 Tax=Rana temporaria TaxID=8407 RepID=UPI001AACE8CD|nr:bone sialoprotein 2-like isoform X2 [Rana temporaria]
MKTALIFIVLWSLSSAFYINNFRKWKGDDSDEKGASRNRYGYFFRRVHVQAPPKYITYARAGGSSEEEDSSDEQEDSVDAGKNGKNAASEEAGGEGKGAEEEEADSEGGEEENGGTSAPEVEDSTASQNETDTEQPSTVSQSSTEIQPTQAATIASTTEAPYNNGGTNEILGNEEGSNGGAENAAAPYYPDNRYNEHYNPHDPYGNDKGDYYRRYEEYYRQQLYAHHYQYYQ